MGGRGTSSGIGGGSRTFNHLHEANTFFGVGESKGMFPDWQKDITAEEKDAAVYYTTNAYKEINKWLRGVGGLDPKQEYGGAGNDSSRQIQSNRKYYRLARRKQ